LKLRIGLTGGIGSGKSTVGALLVQRGATLVDTDAIARGLTEAGGAAIETIAASFGPEFITPVGSLDRDRMRSLVFSQAAAKLRLEAILHPLIGIETDRQERQAKTPVLVFDVPLLAESSKWRTQVDRILVIDCTQDTQIRRVMARSGLSEQVVAGIVAQQATRSLRRACADAVIHNDSMSLDALKSQVQALWAIWVRSPA
jgi:dephospho-CoA kinase